MLALHSDGHYDLTIQVADKEFKAFKYALMSCSDVFRRMLSCSNSTESKTGIIKINDIKPAVIEALLKWIYQAEIVNMEEVADDLYRAADKYDIDLLKKKCINVMFESFSMEDAMSRLMLAYDFNDEKLKERVLNFLNENSKHLKSLMASDEWTELSINDPELRKKIMDDIFD